MGLYYSRIINYLRALHPLKLTNVNVLVRSNYFKIEDLNCGTEIISDQKATLADLLNEYRNRNSFDK